MDPVTDSPGLPSAVPELSEAIAEARGLAREQVAAAWQIHLDRIREQIDAGWREGLDEIFEQHFAGIEQRLRDTFDLAVAGRARAEAERVSGFLRDAARRDLTETLNTAVRRLRQSETREIWVRTLLEAVAGFCGRAALFGLRSKVLQFEGGIGVETSGDIEIPLASAPAFTSVIESMDTVVAAGTPRELSQSVADLLGDAPGKVYLFPVVLHQKPVAVLYAEPSEESGIDVSALELLTSLAGSSMDTTEVTVESRPAELVRITGVAEEPKSQPSTSWPELSKREQEVHLRARRFARTRVAEMVLHRIQAIRAGRASRNLYGALREEIDAGRDAYRRFIDTCPSMVDYYHLELVRSVAKDDAGVLGPDYPGPLP